ncbi:MAG: protein tyrosine phosphatase family protein [Ascidiaceihabitans sp.]|nr:protein tyrosine phosphatase family protein [Ascidiaceihabitans sp.]
MTDLCDVINWRRRDSLTTMSGQPTEDQMARIKALGVRDVINLGPHTNTGALPDETGTLAALGMNYIYMPVDFSAPTQADFDAFCAALAQLKDRPVHVHCIYNARVSAFFYRYARERRGGNLTEAFALMDGIWRPGGVWASFIDKPEDIELPIRYAGYDY